MDSKNLAIISAGKKVSPGQEDGRVKGLYDSFTLTEVLALNAEIDSLYIPEGALITNAWIKSPSLGSTGTVQMGLRAHENSDAGDVPEDSDGLVASADAGGQAVFQRNAGEALIGKTIGKGGAQVFLTCTEASTATSGTIEWVVEYLHA